MHRKQNEFASHGVDWRMELWYYMAVRLWNRWRGTPENMDERRIGSEHDGRFLDEMIDEVRIYDRVLDEDEVAQNFEVELRGTAIEPGSKLATTWGRIKI
jgi:hypothetical protein